MEALALAQSFSTIVSLIGQYRASRGMKSQSNYNDFLGWLAETNHEEVKQLLEMNAKASIGIKALLLEKTDSIMSKLDALDSALAHYASNYDGFSQLVEAIRPEAALSPQAISILKQLDQSGGNKILESHSDDGINLFILGAKAKNIQVQEDRFIEDDLKTLVDLGLLRPDCNSSGDNLYVFTRAAAKLVRSVGLS